MMTEQELNAFSNDLSLALRRLRDGIPERRAIDRNSILRTKFTEFMLVAPILLTFQKNVNELGTTEPLDNYEAVKAIFGDNISSGQFDRCRHAFSRLISLILQPMFGLHVEVSKNFANPMQGMMMVANLVSKNITKNELAMYSPIVHRLVIEAADANPQLFRSQDDRNLLNVCANWMFGITSMAHAFSGNAGMFAHQPEDGSNDNNNNYNMPRR